MAEELHISTENARAGATPGVMRYVLMVSLGLAVIAMLLLLLIGQRG